MAEDTFSPLLISFFFPGRFYTITLGFAHLEVRNSFFSPSVKIRKTAGSVLKVRHHPYPQLHCPISTICHAKSTWLRGTNGRAWHCLLIGHQMTLSCLNVKENYFCQKPNDKAIRYRGQSTGLVVRNRSSLNPGSAILYLYDFIKFNS